MKIKMTTIREFPSDEYWEWVQAVNGGVVNGPLNGGELIVNKKFIFTSEDTIGFGRKTKATTTYEILED